ncbi:hypothetical protein [Conexibacter sp. SYSU D00693]|uniref:hypothetical protein n=1 Tax=Conexibacter sp. SYSU D00693 TaxID=2812560 RepID=UPI00196AD23C|nr:hypothetical protein [Conexibacter sp. SYSU D00693]
MPRATSAAGRTARRLGGVACAVAALAVVVAAVLVSVALLRGFGAVAVLVAVPLTGLWAMLATPLLALAVRGLAPRLAEDGPRRRRAATAAAPRRSAAWVPQASGRHGLGPVGLVAVGVAAVAASVAVTLLVG